MTRRYAGIAGIAFVISFVAGQLGAGSLPAPGADPSEILSYLVQHTANLQAAVLLTLLGIFLFAFFFAGLVNLARGSPLGDAPSVTLILFGGIGAAVALASLSAVYGALTVSISPQPSLDLAAFGYRLAFAMDAVGRIFVAVLLFGSAMALSSRVRPWVIWLAVTAGVLQVLSSIAAVSTATVYAGASLASFALSLLWILVIAIWMVRHPEEEPAIP